MATKTRNSELDVKQEIASFVDRIKTDAVVTPAQLRKLKSKLNDVVDFCPKVGVFGKTGAGKSSLCNALFGQRIAKVSNVKACTRTPQEVLVNLTPDGAGMTLVDVPGVGESRARDDEYRALYENLLPELDLVLWVLKGDDRAYSVDEAFYQEVVLPALASTDVPVIFVVNQVDKIEADDGWDAERARPGRQQLANIRAKVKDVKQIFKQPGVRRLPTVIPVAANRDYNLVQLIDTLVESMPDAKKFGLAREVRAEHVAVTTITKVKTGLWNTVKAIATNVFVEVAPKVINKAIEWCLGKIIMVA